MVKIVDKGPELRKRDEKLSKLAKIAQDALPRDFWKVRESNAGPLGLIIDYSQDINIISVHDESRTIWVNQKSAFDYAVDIARAYEKHNLGEFTIEKHYF